MLHKVVMTFFALVVLFSGEAALAQAENTIPEFDPLCWTQEQCYDARAGLIFRGTPYDQLSGPDKVFVQDGFVKGEGACKGGQGEGAWGKCLPGTAAKTSIAFGGKREFADIGDFIRTNYTFLISVAAILAVIMIIVAGFQWVMSGGNSEAISSAKKRIGGAVIGLFIAYTSYFILNTINPSLVNFRLPQTWMVRSQQMTPQFCLGAPTKTQFNFATGYTDQVSPVSSPSGTLGYKLTHAQAQSNSKEFYCGHRFFMEGGGSVTCFGHVCPGANESCVLLSADDPAKQNNPKLKYGCKKGDIFLRLAVSPLEQFSGSVFSGLFANLGSEDWLDNSFTLYGVCRAKSNQALRIGEDYEWGGEGKMLQLMPQAGQNFNEYDVIFGDIRSASIDWECTPNEEFVGVFITNEIDINLNIFKDARFIVGYKNHTGPAAVGIWGKQVTINDYLPVSLTQPTISDRVIFTSEVLKDLTDNKGTYPQN